MILNLNAKDLLSLCYGWSDIFNVLAYWFLQFVELFGLSFPPVSQRCKELYDILAGG